MRRVGLLAVDLVLVWVSAVFASILRDNFDLVSGHIVMLIPYYALSMTVAVPILLVFGLNRSVWRYSGLSDYVKVVVASALIVSGTLFGSFLINRQEGVARSLPLIQFMFMVAAMVGIRVVSRVWHGRRRHVAPLDSVLGDERRESVLVVGLTAMAELYIRAIREAGEGAPRIEGLLGRKGHHTGRLLQSYRVLGTPEEIDAILARLEVHGVQIDRIVVTCRLDHLSPAARDNLLAVTTASSIVLDILPERLVAPGGERVRDRTHLPLATGASGAGLKRAPDGSDRLERQIDPEGVDRYARRPYWRVKRVIDVVLSVMLIMAFLPLLLVTTLLVITDTGFPFMFWQLRPGLGGRPFRLYKFRTMAGRYDAQGHVVPDEKRTSACGRFLRRTRLDELPQLLNILFGDMSFVGPRPLLPVDQSADFAARLLVRPGLTGWAQVMGGRIIGADDKAALDVWYICKASLWLDLSIIVATVRMVVAGERSNGNAIGQAWLDLSRLGLRRGRQTMPGLVPGE